LVLDEATSSVDPETEVLVQHGIHALMEGRTSIVIAHRLSTIQDVDRIHVLHHGRIVETGSHDQLLAKRGAYWRLYQLQFERSPEVVARAAG
jgi:ATP-binding cassette subfamily B protein